MQQTKSRSMVFNSIDVYRIADSPSFYSLHLRSANLGLDLVGRFCAIVFSSFFGEDGMGIFQRTIVLFVLLVVGGHLTFPPTV